MELLSYSDCPLFQACANGNIEKVKELLDKGADIKIEEYYELSPLYAAIFSKNETIINLLLKKGYNINKLDKSNTSALHAAAEFGDVKVFEYLLERGANIDQKDDYGRTPFTSAVFYDKGPLVEMLIEKGINVNVQDHNGIIPLHYAASSGGLVRTLLNAGSEVDLQDIDGETPLSMAAIRNDNSDIMALMLNRGARINIKDKFGITPLLRAIKYAAFYNVEYLLNAGACIDVKPFDGSYFGPENDIIKTKTVLKKHLIKLLAANISIDASEVTRVYGLGAIDCAHFEESCILEVDKMKIKKFRTVSLYDVLIKTVNPTFADNIELEQFINSDNLMNEFPKYAALLKIKFKEAKKRNNLLKFTNFNIKIKTRDVITVIYLPNEIKRQILCYLNNNELENVKIAFQDVS